MGILDSIKKLFGGGSSEPTTSEGSTSDTGATEAPETTAPEIGGDSGDQTPTA